MWYQIIPYATAFCCLSWGSKLVVPPLFCLWYWGHPRDRMLTGFIDKHSFHDDLMMKRDRALCPVPVRRYWQVTRTFEHMDMPNEEKF